MLRLEPLEDQLAPAILTVNTLADETVADNILSLREAVAVVDAQSTSALSSTAYSPALVRVSQFRLSQWLPKRRSIADFRRY